MHREDELISVAMATYEGGRFINDQLSSIAAQTVLPHEVVIFDDGSTDNTVDIVRGFASSAPFEVRFVVNERRLGITRNFESAIYACKGGIVFLCDQDDVWYPEKVEKTLACFRRSEAVGVVCSDADVSTRPCGRSARYSGSLWVSVEPNKSSSSMAGQRKGCFAALC